MSNCLDTFTPGVVGGTVTEYKYYMNDKHTGSLYLLNDTEKGEKKCMWRSVRTNICTKWHGRWSITDGQKLASFCCHGHENFKWSIFDEDGIGRDYRGREIRVQVTRKWHFDAATSSYFDEPS